MTIWLAMITQDETEYHVNFEGHDTLESAKTEMADINNRLRLDQKIPLPYYVYEADEPLYGYEEYKLDELDFNFYREPTPEELASKNAKLKELEAAFETGDESVIEETAQKILDEVKQSTE